jgi:hypothetical protein
MLRAGVCINCADKTAALIQGRRCSRGSDASARDESATIYVSLPVDCYVCPCFFVAIPRACRRSIRPMSLWPAHANFDFTVHQNRKVRQTKLVGGAAMCASGAAYV